MDRKTFNNDWQRHSDDGNQKSLDALLIAGLVFALAFLLASFMPGPLVAATLQRLLWWSAMGFAVLALIRGEEWQWDCVNAWHQAAMLFVAGLIAGLAHDPEAAREFVQMKAQQAAGAAR